MKKKICAQCGKEYKASHWNSKYCSNDCATLARKEQQRNYQRNYQKKPLKESKGTKQTQLKECITCGKTFIVSRKNKEFCSKQCSVDIRKKGGTNKQKSNSEHDNNTIRKATFEEYNKYIKENGYITYGKFQTKKRLGEL